MSRMNRKNMQEQKPPKVPGLINLRERLRDLSPVGLLRNPFQKWTDTNQNDCKEGILKGISSYFGKFV